MGWPKGRPRGPRKPQDPETVVAGAVTPASAEPAPAGVPPSPAGDFSAPVEPTADVEPANAFGTDTSGAGQDPDGVGSEPNPDAGAVGDVPGEQSPESEPRAETPRRSSIPASAWDVLMERGGVVTEVHVNSVCIMEGLGWKRHAGH